MSDARMCFVSPDGTDAFLRFGDDMYRMRADDDAPRQMLVEKELSLPWSGIFMFEDPKTMQRFRLEHDNNECVVRIDGDHKQAYVIGVMPSDMPPLVPLQDYDFRQTPALLLAARDTNLLVYLSRAVHRVGDGDHVFSRLFLIELKPDGRPKTWHDYGQLQYGGDGYPLGARKYHVGNCKHPLFLYPVSVLDTGAWGQVGDSVLEKVPLENYRIQHESDGNLIYFAPKG